LAASSRGLCRRIRRALLIVRAGPHDNAEDDQRRKDSGGDNAAIPWTGAIDMLVSGRI
jgi:hypothetical protein